MVRNDRRRLFQVLFGLALSIASLAAIFFFVDARAIWRVLQTTRLSLLVPAALGIVAFLVLRAIRWRFMLGNRVSYGDVFHIQNIGYMLTNVLPLRIGEIGRAVLIGSVPPLTVGQGISTMVMERLLDLLFILVLLPFTLLAVGELPPNISGAVRVLGIVAVAGTAVLILAANQRRLAGRVAAVVLDRLPFFDTASWVKRIDDLLIGLESLTRLKDAVILIVLSVLVWAPIVFAYFMTMRAVNLEATAVIAAFVVAIAALSIAAPSSPGQVGIFHGGVTWALASVVGLPADASAGFAFLYHGLNFAMVILMGLIGVRFTHNTFGQIVARSRDYLARRQSGGEA